MLLYWILDSKSCSWEADSAVECGQEVIGKGSSKDKLFKQVQLEDAAGCAGGTNGIKFQKFHRTVGWRNSTVHQMTPTGHSCWSWRCQACGDGEKVTPETFQAERYGDSPKGPTVQRCNGFDGAGARPLCRGWLRATARAPWGWDLTAS